MFAPEPDVFQPDRSLSKPGFRTWLTWTEAVLVLPESVAVTVCGPPAVAVQLAPLHDPSGAIEKDDADVTSPIELLAESNPWTVKACAVPEMTVTLDGLIAM